MASTPHLLAFVVTATVLIAIPGPSVLFTVGRALTVGRRDALITVVGNEAGLFAQVVLVAVGLGAVVQRSVLAYTVIKLAGAAYLVYLGARALARRSTASDDVPTPQTAKGTGRVLREGALVGATNPKMLVFLTAAMPQFVDPDAGHVVGQILVLGAILVLIALLLDSAWAFAAGTARDWFAQSPRRMRGMSAAGGVAMIGLGASFVLVGHRD